MSYCVIPLHCLYLFIMLYKVALTFEKSVEKFLKSVTVQMKSIEQHFPAALFIML